MEYIIPIVSIEALGDYSFTKFIHDGRKNNFFKLLGYICYIGVLELFQKSIELKGLIWTNTAWDGWSNIATGLVGLLIFGEKPSLRETIGIGLVILGIFFLGTDGITSYKDISKK
jgi:multidrug transporter EmrE-like cation transporter